MNGGQPGMNNPNGFPPGGMNPNGGRPGMNNQMNNPNGFQPGMNNRNGFAPGGMNPNGYPPGMPPNGRPPKVKKPIHKRWWFWVLIVFFAICVIGAIGGGGSDPSGGGSANADKPEVTVVDFSAMDTAGIQSWADTNKVVCEFEKEYSDTVASGAVISQNVEAEKVIHEGDTVKVVISRGKKPSVEYLNALAKAELYSKTMYMSRQGIYDQLVSEYGEKFPADAAQYAIDNMDADWNANALEKAKMYQSTMSMSKSAVYDQLVSQYGEKFTKDQAQYAIDHLDD